MTQHVGVAVAGGGRAGLAVGCHRPRQGVDSTVLSAEPAPGEAWQHMGDSPRLFSPADRSCLPGRLMPAQTGGTRPDAGLAGTCRGPSPA
ncbi:hypothetical protein ACFW4T_09920 [Streptomyces mutabilis]|uniref:hypothetical protein n=1 Tax=Streptomyces mutabilis TaxID=67332 RepID=UPI00368F0FE9